MLLEAVVESLDEIRSDKSFNAESTTKANGLYHAITQSKFILSLIVVKEALSYTRGLTIKLQGQSIELSEAYKDGKGCS